MREPPLVTPVPAFVLTLYQPWASLMVVGKPAPPKSIETRGWGAAYRGRLWIHASAQEPAGVRYGFSKGERAELLVRHLGSTLDLGGAETAESVLRHLPRGLIIGSVELYDIERITPVLVSRLNAEELVLGDYGEGRFAWRTRSPRLLSTPIVARGRQKLWRAHRDVAAQLEHAT